MQTFISKARKPKFELFLKIFDLNNVPLVSGTCHVKWHLPSSIAAEHRGRTERAPIKEHKVVWDYTRTIPIRLTIDRSNVLQECLIHLEVVQDYSGGGRGEKITLGQVAMNLAEYVDAEDASDNVGDEGVTRRYLMQESKINSTVKVGIAMRQVDGERNYTAPTLKLAPVFGGIAGIIAGEEGASDDGGPIPSIQKSRDLADLQDLYRHSVAHMWHKLPHELPATDCIEDIFAGGDGFSKNIEPPEIHHQHKSSRHHRPQTPSSSHHHHENSSTSDLLDRRSPKSGHRRVYSGGGSSQSTIVGSQLRSPGGKLMSRKHERSNGRPGSSGGQTITPEETSNEGSTAGGNGYGSVRFLNEFDVREDLVAWRLPGG